MKIRTIVALFVMTFVGGAWYASGEAQTLAVDGYAINAKGTGGSPVAVGTSTPVVIMAPGSRCDWYWRWTEAGNLRCQPFPVGTSSPTQTPTATHGLIFGAGSAAVDAAVLGDPSMGWSCVSDSGTLNVSTAEFARCLKKGNNP